MGSVLNCAFGPAPNEALAIANGIAGWVEFWICRKR